MTETTTPIDALAERFWESFLQLHPTTATMYGDPRYDDRLDDPGPAGRAAIRKLAEDTRAEAQAIDPVGLSTEDRITRDMLIVLGDLAVAEDDLGMHRLRGVDQIAGPQTVLPQIATLQPADTPERLERFLARLRAYGPYMDAYHGILRESLDSGVTAPRIVTERTIEQLKRLLAIPLDQAIVPSMAQVASDADRERVREVVGEVVYPADGPTSTLLEASTSRRAARSPGLWAAPGGDALYRTVDPLLDDARPGARGRPPDRHGGARGRSTRSARAPGREARLRRRRDVPTGPRSPTTRRTRQQSNEELVARAREDIDRADGRRAAVLRTPAAGGLRGQGRSRSSRRRTRRSRTTSRRRSTASRPGIYYVNGYDLPSRTYLEARDDHLPRSDPGSPLPDRAGDGAPVPQRVPPAGLAPRRRRLRRGLGPVLRERLADEMGLYRDDAERFGMLDAQSPGVPRGWSSTRGIHGLRWSRQQSIDFLLETGLSNTDADDRDRPLHRLAGPGPDVHDRLREIRRLRARDHSSGTGRRSTCARSTTRSWVTGRCRSPRSRASCRAGCPRLSSPPAGVRTSRPLRTILPIWRDR